MFYTWSQPSSGGATDCKQRYIQETVKCLWLFGQGMCVVYASSGSDINPGPPATTNPQPQVSSLKGFQKKVFFYNDVDDASCCNDTVI